MKLRTVEDFAAVTGRLAAPDADEPASDRAQRRWLQRGIAHAASNEGFLLHFQPRLSLASGKISSAEALLRWPHRKRGLIPPTTFIPYAEQSGLMVSIGGWALRTACIEAARWGGVGVSVNVSIRQLEGGTLSAQVAAALDASGLAPELLDLEFTESMLMAVDLDTLLTLSAIRDLGVGIALDDFGAGIASLSMLKRLPLSTLKLDRSMVRDLPHDREDAAIARAAIEAAHALGLTVVAEGVETESQRMFLHAIGCDEGHGFLFSHPLPAGEMRARLAI